MRTAAFGATLLLLFTGCSTTTSGANYQKSNDLMTDLINAEVEEADGTTRPLDRTEILTYISTIMGAGSETTTRLIGFSGQLLSDHPDQRRQLAADPALTDVIAIDEALSQLEATDPRKSKIVTLRYYAGLSVEEIAEVLEVSPRTVLRDWRLAKLWLRREMARGGRYDA